MSSFSVPNNRQENRSKQRLRSRRGAAIVEAAVCLPVFMLIILGMIQLINMLHFRQKVSMAGFIGMQAIAQPLASDEWVEKRVSDVLDEYAVTGASLTISPPGVLETADNPQLYTLRVTVPMNSNIPYPKLFPIPTNYTVELSLFR
jgi:Flp pilus assembly protein TadG